MKKTIKKWLASNSIAGKLTRWIISTVLAFAISFAFIFVVLQTVDWYYIAKHPVALVEEDLGYGLVMFLSLLLAAIGAIPIAILSFLKFKNKIVAWTLLPNHAIKADEK